MSLRDIVDAATPGPWTEMVLGSEGYVVHAEPPEGQRRPRCVARCGYEAWEVDKANAEFIATFDPQLVGRLLDIVGAARDLLQLKDGPRDDDYATRKDPAWQALREALGATEVTA